MRCGAVRCLPGLGWCRKPQILCTQVVSMREPGRAGWRLVWRLFAIGSQEIDQLLIMLGRTQLLQLLIRSRFGESGPRWRMSIVPILCHLPLSQRGPPPLIFSEMSRARRPPSTPGQGLGCGGSIRIRLGAARRTARTLFFSEWPNPSVQKDWPLSGRGIWPAFYPIASLSKK